MESTHENSVIIIEHQPVMCAECWLNDRGIECVCGSKPANDFEDETLIFNPII